MQAHDVSLAHQLQAFHPLGGRKNTSKQSVNMGRQILNVACTAKAVFFYVKNQHLIIPSNLDEVTSN